MTKTKHSTIAVIAFVITVTFGFAPGRCLGQDKKPAQPLPSNAPTAQQPAALLPPLAVEVTNDTSHPLPVAGSVSVSGTPNVNVANPVTLAPGTNVNISSSAANPIFVQQAGGGNGGSTTQLLLTATNVDVNGTSTDLGTFDASAFQEIRVSAIDTFFDPTNHEQLFLVLSFVENGQDIPGLEPFQVVPSPHGAPFLTPVNKVYGLPGKTLHVKAVCAEGPRCGPLSLVIYGR